MKLFCFYQLANIMYMSYRRLVWRTGFLLPVPHT
ncbi:hypothetical protein V6Z12_D07G243700 [Gossypium hirsutum]